MPAGILIVRHTIAFIVTVCFRDPKCFGVPNTITVIAEVFVAHAKLLGKSL